MVFTDDLSHTAFSDVRGLHVFSMTICSLPHLRSLRFLPVFDFVFALWLVMNAVEVMVEFLPSNVDVRFGFTTKKKPGYIVMMVENSI